MRPSRQIMRQPHSILRTPANRGVTDDADILAFCHPTQVGSLELEGEQRQGMIPAEGIAQNDIGAEQRDRLLAWERTKDPGQNRNRSENRPPPAPPTDRSSASAAVSCISSGINDTNRVCHP